MRACWMEIPGKKSAAGRDQTESGHNEDWAWRAEYSAHHARSGVFHDLVAPEDANSKSVSTHSP